MYLKKKRCRCCGAAAFRRLDKEVDVDPFFARYGLQLNCTHEAIIPIIDWALQRRAEKLPAGARTMAHRILTGLRRKTLLTSSSLTIPYGICEDCDFLAPWFRISDDQLSDYYAHYLTSEYKAARIEYQPGYANIAGLMGSDEENSIRRESHTRYLMPFLIEYMSIHGLQTISLLDYGGGEGGVQPRSERVKSDIYEIAADQDTNLDKETKLYDCVQCLHVLEHVGDPRDTCMKALDRCKSGGILYIEVPIEFPGKTAVEEGRLPACHEHINKFCLKAIQNMLLSMDGKIVRLHTDTVNFLHLEGMTSVIRGILKKS